MRRPLSVLTSGGKQRLQLQKPQQKFPTYYVPLNANQRRQVQQQRKLYSVGIEGGNMAVKAEYSSPKFAQRKTYSTAPIIIKGEHGGTDYFPNSNVGASGACASSSEKVNHSSSCVLSNTEPFG